MQNYQQQQSNGFNAFNYPSPTGNGSSPSSAMPSSASTSRLSSLMGNNSSAFDFGMETGSGFRSSSSGFSSGGGGGGGPPRNMPPMGMNHGNQGNNGFSGLFDRSMSGYESSQQNRSNPGFDRQMSVPANLADQGKMNGFTNSIEVPAAVVPALIIRIIFSRDLVTGHLPRNNSDLALTI